MSQTESVKIVISAEDNSAVVLEQQQKRLKEQSKQVKELGRNYQDSGDSVDKFARMLGGGWLSDAGYQMKEFADATVKAREVLAAGGTAATAMKVGIAGLTAVIAFKLGEAMGNIIFQTERWKRELADARVEAEKLAAIQFQLQGRQQSAESDRIAGIADPAEQKAARQAQLEQLQNTIVGQETVLKKMKSQMAKARELGLGGTVIEEFAKDIKAQEDLFQQSIEKQTSIEAEQAAFRDKLQADSDKARQDARAKNEKKFLDDSIAYLKAQAEKKKELDKEEAERFKARFKLDEETRRSGVEVATRRAEDRHRSLFGDLEAAKALKLNGPTPGLQATESRFLSRSNTSQDMARQQLEVSKRNEAIQKANQAILAESAKNLKIMADRLGLTNIVEFN